MTCIVGLIEDDKVYIGGDSAGVSGLSSIVGRKDTKVFKNGEFLIGYTTSFRMGQLLRFSFTPPPMKEGQDLYEYMCTSFINEVVKVLEDNKFAIIENNQIDGGTFLIGVRGRLFAVHDDFQVEEMIDPFNACGCGVYYAFGCMEALQSIDVDGTLSAESKIELALKTAEKYSPGVAGPFNILSI